MRQKQDLSDETCSCPVRLSLCEHFDSSLPRWVPASWREGSRNRRQRLVRSIHRAPEEQARAGPRSVLCFHYGRGAGRKRGARRGSLPRFAPERGGGGGADESLGSRFYIRERGVRGSPASGTSEEEPICIKNPAETLPQIRTRSDGTSVLLRATEKPPLERTGRKLRIPVEIPHTCNSSPPGIEGFHQERKIHPSDSRIRSLGGHR